MSLEKKGKTSKEIAVYLHDATGFIGSELFVKKENVKQELDKLENERWVRLSDVKKVADKIRLVFDMEKYIQFTEEDYERLKEKVLALLGEVKQK